MKKNRRLFWLVLVALVVVAIGAYMFAGYWGSLPKMKYTSGTGAVAESPAVKFAVLSDLHQYDPSLGTTGSAFDTVLHSDRKLLLESEALLTLAIDRVLETEVDFVLVPGDLTKDGEVINHHAVAAALGRFTEAGIPVFVTPGNHDVNNPDAVRFDGDTTEPVPTVSAVDFANIYSAFGYGNVISRDPDSLSYIAEPVPGLLILALDGCRYEDNVIGKHEVVGGRLKQSTLNWMDEQLAIAQKDGKAVIAMSHHGIVEHWKGQSSMFADYLMAEYPQVGEMLASYGVRMVFTGHYHALDVTAADYGKNGILYDIETGSLVTAPCPVRFVELSAKQAVISTITLVDDLKPGTDFAKEANAFVENTIALEATKTLKKYYVSDADAAYISGLVANAFTAHYAGDEDPAFRIMPDTSKLSLWGKVIFSTQKYVLEGLWSDIAPGDRSVTLTF